MNKKHFLGLFLVLSLCATGCNSNNGGNDEPSESDEPSQSQPVDDNPIPAGQPGEFTFDQTELDKAQDIHTDDQNKYLSLQKEYYKITQSDLNNVNAKGSTPDCSSPNAVTLHWNFKVPEGKTVSKYSVVFGQKADLSDGYKVDGTTAKKLDFYNPYLGNNYFKVVANYSDNTTQESPIKVFKVTEQAPRNLKVGSMVNCRDMGGRTTYAGGKIRQGLLYRTCGNKYNYSTEIDDEGKEVMLHQLKVKTEINVSDNTDYNFGNKLPGTTVKNAYMAYGNVPYSNLARNSVRIRQIMEILSNESNYPAFYHCRIGTDRTGITGVMIGGLIGIQFNEIMQDYLFSNFAAIGDQRYPGKTPDNNGDDIKKYIDEILALPGANFQEQTYLALRMIGVPASQLDSIINIMTEGTKAVIPTTAKVGAGDDLQSTATKTTGDYKTPGVYYPVSSNGTVSYTATTTEGAKDVILYMGYTGNVTTSTSTKLSSALSLKIDGETKTIGNTKNLWQAGFGPTKQDSRIGYMFNVLGNYEFTAGQHTIEIGVNSGTFNIASVTIADHPAA